MSDEIDERTPSGKPLLRELEPSFLHDWEAEGERTREGFIEAFRKARDAHDEWRVA